MRFSSTPVEVWDTAVALSVKYGVGRIARTVGLDYGALRKRIAELTRKRATRLLALNASATVEELCTFLAEGLAIADLLKSRSKESLSRLWSATVAPPTYLDACEGPPTRKLALTHSIPSTPPGGRLDCLPFRSRHHPSESRHSLASARSGAGLGRIHRQAAH